MFISSKSANSAYNRIFSLTARFLSLLKRHCVLSGREGGFSALVPGTRIGLSSVGAESGFEILIVEMGIVYGGDDQREDEDVYFGCGYGYRYGYGGEEGEGADCGVVGTGFATVLRALC